MAFGSLGTIWAEIGLNTKQLDAGLMAANLKLAGADRTVTSFGQKLTASSTKMMIAGGLMIGAVAGVGIAAVKMAAQFETSMRNVNSISKLSENQFKALGQSVINMSKQFPQTAKELADGLYDIASSGFQGADGLKVLEASAKAASAGMTTTAVSAKGITAVLNAYGYEAERAAEVSDIMFKTVDKGVITFEELSSTVGDWIGMGKAAGLEFNELSGAIAYMTTKGISAAEAGTSMQRMLVGIIKPSEDMAAVIKNAGFESGEMMLKTLGLTDTMKILNDATGGSITKLIELIPQIRGVRGANALLGAGYEELTDYMKDFNDTAGATDIALAEQSKALNFQLQLLKNNASAIAITLGTQYIPKLTAVTKNLSGFISEHEDATVAIINLGLAVVGSIGGLLLLTGAFGKLRMVMLAHPIGAIIAGFVALNSVATIGANKLEAMDTIWGKMGESILRTLAPLSSIKNGLTENIIVTKALADGTITLAEIRKLGITTMDEAVKKIEELRAAQKESTEATKESVVVTEENIEGLKELYDATDIINIKLAMHARQQRENRIATEENTGAQEEQIKTVDELRASYNQLINTLFDGINATNTLQESEWAQVAAQEAVNKLIKEGKEGTQEYEQAINELDSANQSVIESLYGVYTSTYTTKEEQELARKKALEYGRQLVTSGKWGEESFVSMAQQFGLSGQEIIDIAGNVGIELDTATKERIIKLSVDDQITPVVDTIEDETMPKFKREMGKILGEVSSSWDLFSKAVGKAAGEITSDVAGATGESSGKLYDLSKAIGSVESHFLVMGDSAGTVLINLTDVVGSAMGTITNEFSDAIGAVEGTLYDFDEAIGGVEAHLIGPFTEAIGTASGKLTNFSDAIGTSSGNISKAVGGVNSTIGTFLDLVERMKDKTVTITTKFNTIYKVTGSATGKIESMGGIVGYDTGGIVGMPDIPKAASGMVVPQMGRSYLIQAEEYEAIVNTSQQRNLAEWIMGKANSRPDGNGNSNVPIEIRIPIELDGRIIGESVSRFIYDGTRTKQIGVGIR